MSATKGHSDITDFFLEDATEHLHNINDDLLTLENNQNELGLVDKIFRSIHAIKGSAGMAGFHVTSQLAHKVEDLLGQMRSRELPVSDDVIDLLFQGIDALSHEIDNIADDEDEDESLLNIFVDLRTDFLNRTSPGTVLAEEPAQPQPAKKVAESKPPARKSAVSPLELAERLIRQEQLKEAVAVYHKILKTDPSNTTVQQRLAEAKALYAYLQHIAS
jgi:two-component system chemotaxis sensor kinase CheA